MKYKINKLEDENKEILKRRPDLKTNGDFTEDGIRLHYNNIKLSQVNKRGGARPNSGAKLKYSEETTTIAFRVPVSKVPEIKAMVKSKLKEWEV